MNSASISTRFVDNTTCAVHLSSAFFARQIINRPFLTGPLQFVAGLGPRKAKMLLDYAKHKGFVANRDELLRKTVFVDVSLLCCLTCCLMISLIDVAARAERAASLGQQR